MVEVEGGLECLTLTKAELPVLIYSGSSHSARSHGPLRALAGGYASTWP